MPTLAEAEAFLLRELAGGKVRHSDLQEAWKKAGMSARTINRAKYLLGVRSRRIRDSSGAYWVWELRAGRSSESSAIAEKIHEANVEALIADNLDCVEPGLTLVARQHPAPPVGRIDLLCKDPKGNLVVIEIKRLGARTDSVIDQVTRYIGWVQRHMATPAQVVRGVVVVGRPDPKLAYSARAIPNLSIKSFSVTLQSYSE